MSKSSMSIGKFEVKDDVFPVSLSIRNSGLSFIILIFIAWTLQLASKLRQAT